MNKKTDMLDLDIPKDDIDCWDRYPKHRWIYDLSRLLDAQNIRWSPYKTNEFQRKTDNLNLWTDKIITPGAIYIKEPTGNFTITEMYIIKGEIKLIRHIDPISQKGLDTVQGEVELRLNAFSTLYFQKFTGVINTETFGNEI